MTKKFINPRQHGNKNDGHDNQGKVFFNYWQVSEKIAAINKNGNPGNSADDIIREEADISHLTDPGHKRSEGADNGDETGDDNRLPPMPFIKFMSTDQIFLLEKSNLLLVKDLRPHQVSNPVIHRVACHSGETEEPEQPDRIQSTTGCKSPGGKQKRISRKDREDHQPGFTKDDDKQDPISPQAVISNNNTQMLIEMQKKIDQGGYPFHDFGGVPFLINPSCPSHENATGDIEVRWRKVELLDI